MIEILKDSSYVKDEENKNTEAFCVFDGKEKLGCCICRFEKDDVEILCMEFVNDIYIKMFGDGLVRTVLNAADLRGIKTGICKNRRYFDTLIKIGFCEVKDKNLVFVDILEFFKQGCKQ